MVTYTYGTNEINDGHGNMWRGNQMEAGIKKLVLEGSVYLYIQLFKVCLFKSSHCGLPSITPNLEGALAVCGHSACSGSTPLSARDSKCALLPGRCPALPHLPFQSTHTELTPLMTSYNPSVSASRAGIDSSTPPWIVVT
jgi:hypothetical protein